jgi:3-phenylpropionate/trans-cinnamate dioxygenase ferredoxin subunit
MAELAAAAFRTVASAAAIPNDFVVPHYLGDRKLRVSIARVEDRLYAFDDLCTRAAEACPLSGGLLTGTTLMCQCHGSRFDVATGAVSTAPPPTRCTSTRCRRSAATSRSAREADTRRTHVHA